MYHFKAYYDPHTFTLLLSRKAVPFNELRVNRVSQVAQWVNNLSAMQEIWFQSLGQEDPLEEGMATHSSIHAWEIPWTEEPDRL